MKHLVFQSCAQFLRTDSHWINKIKASSLKFHNQNQTFHCVLLWLWTVASSVLAGFTSTPNVLQVTVSREPPPTPPPFMPRAAELTAAAAYMAPVRRAACTALSSLCWKQQSAKFNIQTSRSLQPFCLLVSFPFYSFFSSDFRKKDYIMWILLDFVKLF
jgi:hypothetical protein